MIKDLISVIMPTTGRQDAAIACVKLLLDTTAKWAIEIDIPVDVDTNTMQIVGDFLNGYKGSNLKRWRMPFCDHYQGKPTAWNAGLKESKGEYIVFAADDLRWTDGWLDAAMRCMPEGGGLVGFNDLHRTFAMKRESTHYLATRRFIVEHMNGCIGFPHYSGACNDSEACMRAANVGRYVPCYDAIVEHLHHEYNLRPKDATDLLWENGQKSLRELRRRAQFGFPDDFEPAIGPESLRLEKE